MDPFYIPHHFPTDRPMPLETATYISQLNSANPAHTDGLNVDDSHMRLVKAVLLATFPNFTAAPLSSTQAQLDANSGLNGVTVLADAGAHFKTNTTDGVYNPVAGEVDVNAAGVAALKVKSDGSVTSSGSLTSTAAYKGGTGELVPSGATMVWWTDTLPTGYLWANGAAVSRATYGALFTLFGTTFGVGDGSTTFNLPDMREAAPVGKSTMGATSTPSRITNYVATTIGGFIGACLHLLTTGEMPSHTHTATVTDPGHTHAVDQGANSGGGIGMTMNASQSLMATSASAFGNTNSATTGVTVANANQGGGTSHDNVTPSVVCNWIIKT